ncbi:thioredoxin-like domain-containing protein [Galbibacter sp. BG1]
MKKILFLTISSLLIFFTSCQKSNDSFKISAKLEGFPENSKVKITDTSTGKVLDSTTLRENQFTSIGFIAESPTTINIQIKSNSNDFSSTFIFIGNEDVKISGSKKDFPDALTITGSKYQKYKSILDSQTRALNKERNKKLQKMFTLRQEGKWNDSLQNAYWSRENGIITKIDNQTDQIRKKFIEDNINSDYALTELITYKTYYSKKFIENQIAKLTSDYKNSKYVKVLKTYLENKPLEKGDKFYDFTAENQNGKQVPFSEFFKNKYVLLEFSSNYCGWCFKALPEIKKLSKEQSDSLEIITVNIDNDKKDWIDKYKSNNLTWNSLYAKNGRYSNVYTKYHVYGTPTYYLFDQNGTVVEKWDGYNDELIDEIKMQVKNGN